MHVAYLNQQPIATGILVLHANAAGIYYVATALNQQKKGHGTAMMEHLLTLAKAKGYHLSTLQASQEGKSLYERQGFQPLTTFKEYAYANN